MPVASRRTLLPRPVPGPLGRGISWGCLAIILLWPVYFYPVAAAPLAVIILFSVLLGRREKLRQARIAAERSHGSICTFVRGFDYRRVDTCVLRAVYEELQPCTSFSLRASDELEGTLHLDRDDLDLDIVPVVAARTGRSMKNTRANPYYDRVRTVADLVAFFCAQPITGVARG